MAKTKSDPATGPHELLVAKESFSTRFEGADHSFAKGDIVEAGHKILRGIEHLFEPVVAKPAYRVPRDMEPPATPRPAAPSEKA